MTTPDQQQLERQFAPDPMGFGDESQQRADAEANRAGVRTVTKTRTNFWGTDVTYRFYLPGEDPNDADSQFIEYKKMTEGDRAKYQRAIADPVLVHRGSGDARMKVDPARDRAALLETAVCGWHLWKGDRLATFNATQFNLWRNAADPDLIDKLEKAIRKDNPWLKTELSLKDATEERDRLIDLVKELEDAEEEKDRSERE